MDSARQTRVWVRGLTLRSSDFPDGTPLNHFFAWNERARRRDRRYIIARDLYCLITGLANGNAQDMAIAHLSLHPMIVARRGHGVLVQSDGTSRARILAGWKLARRELVMRTPFPPSRRRSGPMAAMGTGVRRYGDERIAPGRSAEFQEKNTSVPDDLERPAVAAARRTVAALLDAIGSANVDRQAAVFAAFERMAGEIDLGALARRRPRLIRSRRRPSPRRILVIRLSALGDFAQALGPIAAIRRHHQRDHLTLLTTTAFAEFAQRLGFFDDLMIDHRPGLFDLGGWAALRRGLRAGRYDRVYDLQTSDRSAAYQRLFRPGALPEWSGSAAGCSHPHANLGRDHQHTIDKQAEQLLMAGIHPTPLPLLPPLACELPQRLAGRQFALLVPGSSPRHLAKRWPAQRFGALAQALRDAGYVSVVIGSDAERAVAATVRGVCPDAIDLAGQTALEEVAALAQHAVLAIGNDTGVIHLAAAAGCPVVVLFSGATDPDWCAPRGRLVRVLAVQVLAELGLDQVLAEVRAILAQCTRPAAASRPQRAAGEATARGANARCAASPG